MYSQVVLEEGTPVCKRHDKVEHIYSQVSHCLPTCTTHISITHYNIYYLN
jgi:hypothetical protein